MERGCGVNILEDARPCSVLYIRKYFEPEVNKKRDIACFGAKYYFAKCIQQVRCSISFNLNHSTVQYKIYRNILKLDATTIDILSLQNMIYEIYSV